MSALRPIFAAAGVLLLVAVVLLGIRSTDDAPTPSADGGVSPSAPVTQPDDAATGTDDPQEPVALPTSPAPTETDGPAPDATSSPSEDGTAPGGATGGTTGDGSSTGAGSQDQGSGTGGTSAGSGSSDGSGTSDGSESSDGDASDDGGDGEEDRPVVAIGEGADDVDDMPDTGGGLATVLGGVTVLGAAMGLRRRG